MPKRRQKRVTMPLHVKVWGLDADGKVFRQNARTMNITPSGARLYGIKAKLEPGFTIGVQCGTLKSRFIVVWVGEPGTPCEDQIGLRGTDSGVWGVPFPKPGEEYLASWWEEILPDQK